MTVKELIKELWRQLEDSGKVDLPVRLTMLDDENDMEIVRVYHDADTTGHCKTCKCDKSAKTLWIDLLYTE